MAGVLASLSEALATIVAQAGSTVVRVEGRRGLPASGIVWSTEGVIVTAHHVVEQDDNISLGLADGQRVPATLVGRDPATDIAVLRAQLKGLGVPIWADPASLRVGHLVLALGRPGETVRATLGMASALGQGWSTPAGGRVDRYLQTDIVMYPGFSGGPLLDAEGRTIGLNTSALLRGISITVPSGTVRQVVETLLSHGRVQRGYLGVGTQPVRLPPALGQQVNQETGMLVINASPGSPAEQAGLLLGDVILTLGGQPVRSVDDLRTIITGAQVGGGMVIKVVRGGQIRELNIKIGDHP